MFAGSIGTNIVPKEFFGIPERFSVFAATVFNAVLGVYLFFGFNEQKQQRTLSVIIMKMRERVSVCMKKIIAAILCICQVMIMFCACSCSPDKGNLLNKHKLHAE